MSDRGTDGVGVIAGRVLDGRYVIGDPLGEGGMGIVYAARQSETQRQVAIKVLRSEPHRLPEALERFRREARAAGLVGHDNICDVLDVGRLDDGTPYLVMPLLRGRTLGAVLREAGPLPVARVVDIGAQILSGLAAAHGAGIIHRDLKPENVFLVRMGDRDDFVKLLDFGISKSIDAPASDGAITHTGSVVGTPFYMAPEQARGRKDLDARVDLYAVGVMLYRMTTGRLPFAGDGYNAIISSILVDPYPPPGSLRPDLPRALEAVILRAMDRDRHARFASAGEMRAALLAVVPDGAGTACRPAEAARTEDGHARFGELSVDHPSDLPADPANATVSSRVATVATASLRTARLLRSRWVRSAGLVALGAAVAAVVTVLLVDRRPRDDRPPAAPVAVAPSNAAQAPVAASAAGTETWTPRPEGQAAPETGRSAAGDPIPPSAASASDAAGGVAPEAGAAADAGAAATAAERIAIELLGLPPGAVVRVDGRRVDGPMLDLPRSAGDVLIDVSASGYRGWRRLVPAVESASVRVSMGPLGQRDAAAWSETGGGTGRGGNVGRPPTAPGLPPELPEFSLEP